MAKDKEPRFSETCSRQDNEKNRHRRVTLNGNFNFTITKPPLRLDTLKTLEIRLSAVRTILKRRKKKNGYH